MGERKQPLVTFTRLLGAGLACAAALALVTPASAAASDTVRGSLCGTR